MEARSPRWFLGLGLMLAAASGAADVPAKPCALTVPESEVQSQICEPALSGQTDPKQKAQLLFNRAFALNEQQKYQQALAALDEACALDPHNPRFLHERGFTRSTLGDYEGALVDLDEDQSLVPDDVSVYRERAFSRFMLGNFAGAFADRDREVQLQPESSDAWSARAEARLWLGQFDDARSDLAKALELAKSKEAIEFAQRVSRSVDLWSRHSADEDPGAHCKIPPETLGAKLATAIGDCTVRFLAAKDGAAKAEALTARSLAWLLQEKSTSDWRSDARIAVALDPGNADWHVNLGFCYLENAHSWAGRQEFDKALAIKKSEVAYAGRASANFNLNDKRQAFEDAKASFELKPNEIALYVLGDLANDRKDTKSARVYWMGAYHMGSRDDRLMERLRSVGVTHPESEPK